MNKASTMILSLVAAISFGGNLQIGGVINADTAVVVTGAQSNALESATITATNALARLDQLEQYGDASIVPSPDGWFTFAGGEITGFNYVAGREHVVIPYAIGGIPVTSIGESAFQYSSVSSVIAPKTVTSVGDFAFEGCTKLTSVSLPLVTAIGDYAFKECTELATVSFPSVTSIDFGAFKECTKLATVSFPSATSFGFAFEWCESLTSITLGKTPPTTWDAGTVDGATIYVPHDASEDYGTEWNGMPVIRATESADNYYLGGKTLENRFGEKANAETIYTGAVCPASEGTRYYWASGTNVALSVGTISNGGTVNIAKLNNTGTNSITAIGKAGWVWTGGEMTNTITAGKSMTFGFLVDPSNGKTNAYATGVSK